jgi:hypothetical protein
LPGAAYGFWDYNGWMWDGYGPSYATLDTFVGIEVNVYSVAGSKLQWSGVTSSVNPSSVDRLVGEVAGAVLKELRTQGLI